MATPSSISAFVTQATAQGLTFAQIRDCVKYAMIAGMSDDGRTVTIMTSDGTTMGVLSYEAAANALRILHELALGDIGPQALAPQFMPFDSGSYGGP